MADIVHVKNLTDNPVVYLIPEDNIRRVFAPYEEKAITKEELNKVYYQPGGATLIQDFLQIKDEETAVEFGVDPDVFHNEYSWDVEKVDKVLREEHIDVLHDALDFAPDGIIDLIIDRAVAIRVPDVNKRALIYKETGKNIDQMIKNQIELEKLVGTQETEKPRERRVKTENAAPTERRVAQD